ncbi:hypothetical protein ASZ78_007551 [Callipepla squamata]|uniref:Uncharacterized protein n=1 Tax=Callipepla squamata TaxID=9009 RepID=A0A226MU95_CALSU|nr:hypothetical protein ASZ78_007551 [Callipepla squamata]
MTRFLTTLLFSPHRQVLVQTTLLTMDILQLTENVLLRSRAWTWPRCHHVNVPGTTDQGPLTPEKWMLQVDLQRRGGKDVEIQELPRERQNRHGLILWMETITMDSTGMKLSAEALQEAVTLPGEEGVEAIGEEEIT